MTTSSYLEYILTILGWVVNNGLWDVLTGTGLLHYHWALKSLVSGSKHGKKGMMRVIKVSCRPDGWNMLFTGHLSLLSPAVSPLRQCH